jgi:hypothetical protein
VPYRSPAVHKRVMDVNGVLVDGGGTGVVVMWRVSEARGRNILYTARDGGGGSSAGVSGA